MHTTISYFVAKCCSHVCLVARSSVCAEIIQYYECVLSC